MNDKRFKWVYIKDDLVELQDNGVVKICPSERLEELLNELHEENMKLALQVRMLEQVKPIRKIPKSIDIVWGDNNKILKLEKENEQLKKQLRDIDKLVYDLGSEEFQRQFEELIE